MHCCRNQSPKIVQRPIWQRFNTGITTRLRDALVEINFGTCPIVKALLASAEDKIAECAVRPGQSRSRAKNVDSAVA